MSPERPTERERGVALLTVLMLVAVIAVIAGAALERLRLATRLVGNAVSIEAARSGARMAEVLATTRLDDLLGRDPSRVTLEGGWSGRPLHLPLPGGGAAVARVSDGGNCFNLNGLVTRTNTGTYVDYAPARLALARLIRLVGGGGESDSVAAAAQDWIDSDDEQQAGGAEDQVYLGLPQPYRTAGTLMADPSELRAVSGVTPELYQHLRPFLCTLPVAAPAKLNVNTLSPEQAPLLAAWLAEGSGAGGIRQALLQRPPTGYASTAAFWAAGQSGTAPSGDASALIAVTTTWFRLDVDVRQGSTNLQQQGLIDATHLPARVVARQWGEAT